MAMKQDKAKTPKNRKQVVSRKGTKTACGTLSYIAECRGAVKSDGTIRRTAPPDNPGNIERT